MKLILAKLFSNELFNKLSFDLTLRLVDAEDDEEEDIFVFDELE